MAVAFSPPTAQSNPPSLPTFLACLVLQKPPFVLSLLHFSPSKGRMADDKIVNPRLPQSSGRARRFLAFFYVIGALTGWLLRQKQARLSRLSPSYSVFTCSLLMDVLSPRVGSVEAHEILIEDDNTGSLSQPRWGDLDVNQHVNNVKYIGWILESAPMAILEKHELAGITLEYRRECGRDSVVQFLMMCTPIVLMLLRKILHPSIVTTFSALSLVPTSSRGTLLGGRSRLTMTILQMLSRQLMLRLGPQEKFGSG